MILGGFNKSLMLMYGGVIVYKEYPSNYFYALAFISLLYAIFDKKAME